MYGSNGIGDTASISIFWLDGGYHALFMYFKQAFWLLFDGFELS